MKNFLTLTLFILPLTLFSSNADISESTTTRTVTIVAPTLTSISLESNVTTLNVGEQAQLTLMATYSDGSTKEVETDIEWIITSSDSVDVNGTVLTAKKDNNVTVQAKVGSTLSNTLNLNIAWVVNGHVLPPEPDPTVNDSTLLGIDVNDNGVRDDVERWIYTEYKDKHPIHIDIAMQAGKGWQKVLENPSNASNAKEIYMTIDAPAYCEGYFRVCVSTNMKNKFKLERISTSDTFVKKIIFNTQNRLQAYIQYDTLLSGDSYTIPRCSQAKTLCDFNISKYEE